MNMLETLPIEKQQLITEHLKLVIEANKKINLTRIDSMEEGLLLHVEDSLIALEEVNEAPNGPYADIGSGAGYPGMPIAIATSRKTTLVDSRMKKMQVVGEMIDKLALGGQIDTYPGRAELLARKELGYYSVVTARALAKLPVLLELASPLLERSGRLVCYKAQLSESELNEALRVKSLTGMELVSDRKTMLGEDITRRIIVFEKTSQPTIKLPRQEGMAQKNPL